MALKDFGVVRTCLNISRGILAITVRFLAERLSFCTTSELEANVEIQKHAAALFLSMPIFACAKHPCQ
eukprot:3189182-Heterocapsa_arctica.AAC.1